MCVNLLIQYCDKNPDTFDDLGEVSLNQALDAFNTFDWDSQKRKIELRKSLHLSSSSPTIALKKEKTNESLYIACYEKNVYMVWYQKDKLVNTDLIHEDQIYDNSNRTRELIEMFFQGSLNADEEMFVDPESLVQKEIGRFSIKKYASYLWFLLLPLAIVFISSTTHSDGYLLIEILLLSLALLSVAFGPFLYLLYSYQAKPRVNSIVLLPEEHAILVKYTDRNLKVAKNQVSQCVFSFSKEGNAPWQSFANVVLTLSDKSQLFFTSLSFSKEELRRIIEVLDVNHYSFSGFQTLKTKQYQVNPKLNDVYNVGKEVFEERYVNFSTDKLKEIIANSCDYQAQAVEAAKKELEKRKSV